MPGLFEALRDAVRRGEPVALATIVDGPGTGGKLVVPLDGEVRGDLGDPQLTRVVARDTRGELEAGRSGLRHYGVRGEARQAAVTVFVESFAPPPRMIIFGAVDFTAALVRVAKLLGYRVVVCDARGVFATRERFPFADEVVVEWPHEYLARVGAELGPRDAICVLTHDQKFDVPALMAALETPAGYIGCMGSRSTCEKRDARLREAGATPQQRARIMAPIGLDLGARTPEETAISVCAEIIALHAGHAAPSLRNSDGPIH